MKRADIKIGSTYLAKVSGKLTALRCAAPKSVSEMGATAN